MYLGADYSATAESDAFKRLHNLTVAITQLKAQGNAPGVQSLIPYYRQALADYKAAGASDPEYLSSSEQFLLSLGNVTAIGGSLLDTTSKRVLLGLGLYAGILALQAYSKAR